MIFEYQALDKKGNKLSDLIDAPGEASAVQKLRSKGLYVVRIAVHETGFKSKDDIAPDNTFQGMYQRASRYFSLKLSAKQIGIFSRQLATLLKAGMPLIVAITDIIEQIDNKTFKSVVVDIKGKLEEGSSFSNCLTRHKILFSDMYINMVRVGENLGSLDQVIERLSDLEEKKNFLKNKIRAALWYPSFLVIFSSVVIVFLMVNVVPSLARIFVELGKDLPLPTKIILGISSLLSSIWVILPALVIIILSSYYLYKFSKTPEGKYKIDEYKLKIPFFSGLYKKLIVLRFTQNLGVLLNNKVDILKSLEIVKKIVGNSIVEDEIQEVTKKIREGSSMSNALARSTFLPKLVLGMISAGESSDKLDTMLQNIGEVYENELDMTITSLTSMIEPVIIIIMGIIIALIMMSVLLPIFEMNLVM